VPHRLPRTARIRGLAALVAVLAAAAITASCAAIALGPRPKARQLAACVRPAASATSVVAGTPAAVAAGVAGLVFSCAPVVVIASGNHASVARAAARATAVRAPLLLTASRGGIDPAVHREIISLRPRAVLAVGLPAGRIAAQLPGLQVVPSPGDLPATTVPAPARRLAVLVHRPRSAAAIAAAATVRAVRGHVIMVRGDDPRARPAAITALAAARPQRVIAVGRGFGPARRLASRVAVAKTGKQLPGGGQVLFPGHRLVALYGHPGIPALGVLGQRGLHASIAAARRIAARYRRLSRVPVVPAFEIIATIASAHPGAYGDYSYTSPLASLRRWVRAATAAGMYVVLDLQPGRASFLAQARKYAPLLRLPNVGLALDPEWKLLPWQLPLHQIGAASISEINSVIGWLARLTAHYRLPQKLLVIHQFRASMIQDEQRLSTHHDDLAIVIHMDGQGTPADKQQTWDAITALAPPGVFFGWKNFYVKDDPMLSPGQTMARTPKPVMISYQ
jgi:hypothetical protein